MARYRSPLRERQAAETRRRIVAAAADQFARHGYTPTTLGAVAAAAGVSVETVRSVGPKSTLLLSAFELSFTGGLDRMGHPLTDRPEIATRVAGGDGQRIVDEITRWIAGHNARVADLWRTATAAAVDDDDIARQITAHADRLRHGTAVLLRDLADRGLFAPAKPIDVVADLLWNALLPDGYLRLVRHAGWTEERYSEHLAETFTALCRPTATG